MDPLTLGNSSNCPVRVGNFDVLSLASDGQMGRAGQGMILLARPRHGMAHTIYGLCRLSTKARAVLGLQS